MDDSILDDPSVSHLSFEDGGPLDETLRLLDVKKHPEPQTHGIRAKQTTDSRRETITHELFNRINVSRRPTTTHADFAKFVFAEDLDGKDIPLKLFALLEDETVVEELVVKINALSIPLAEVDMEEHDFSLLVSDLRDEELDEINTIHIDYANRMKREYAVFTMLEEEEIIPIDIIVPPHDTSDIVLILCEDGSVVRMNRNTGAVFPVFTPSVFVSRSSVSSSSCSSSMGHASPSHRTLSSLSQTGKDEHGNMTASSFMYLPNTQGIVFAMGSLVVCYSVIDFNRIMWDITLPFDEPVTALCAMEGDEDALFAIVGSAIVALSAQNGFIGTLCGHMSDRGRRNGKGHHARFNGPSDMIYVGPRRLLIVADTENNCIRSVSIDTGEVNTLAGSKRGEEGFLDGCGEKARLSHPSGLGYSAGSRTIYVSDTGNHAIRRIVLPPPYEYLRDNVRVESIVGSGEAGLSDGVGPYCQFRMPTSIGVGKEGELYVLDFGNEVVRKILPPEEFQNGPFDHEPLMPMMAGWCGTSLASINADFSVATVASRHQVLMLDLRNHTSTVLAGNGQAGFRDGPMLEAMFFSPHGACLDDQGVIYIADTLNHRIRKVDPKTQTVTTFCGNGVEMDGEGYALRCPLDHPHSITYDRHAHTLVVGCMSGIKRVNITSGIVERGCTLSRM